MTDNQNSKPKWMPGPWQVSYVGDYDKGYGWDVTSVNGGYKWISSVHHNHGLNNDNDSFPQNEVGQANAILIAAAPELYEALEDLLDRCNRDFWSHSPLQMRNAHAALAKAQDEELDPRYEVEEESND